MARDTFTKRKKTDGEIVADAIDRMSTNVGKWLGKIEAAIITAAGADPEELKQQIARIKALRESIERSVNAQEGEKPNG